MMQTYAEYKDSGVDWLGEIPAGWELTKLGSCLAPFSEKNHADLPLLSITRELGVIERDVENQDTNHNYIPDDLSGYKLLKKGQFGMNKMKAWQGSYGVSPFTGIVSPAYFMFDFTKEIDPDFFHVAIRSKLYVSFFGSASDGVRIGQWDLSKPRMKEIPLALPPLPEQTAIAGFLDEKTAKIDELVGIKRRQIALLGERKQILIQNAVTKGLNPNAPLKDSGVDWIGNIPAHWEVKRLTKEVFVQEGPGIMAVDFHSDGVPLIRISGVKGAYVSLKGCNYLTPMKVKRKWNHFRLTLNDLVISGSASTGLISEVNEDSVGSILYTGLIRIRPISDTVSREFLKLYFGSRYFAAQIDDQKTGSTISHFGPSHLSNMSIFLPSREEQHKIIESCAAESNKINAAITIKQNQITKLNEYKTTLINAAVTGKIKVV